MLVSHIAWPYEVWLSVPVQLVDWKVLPLNWPIICWIGHLCFRCL